MLECLAERRNEFEIRLQNHASFRGQLKIAVCFTTFWLLIRSN
jgi:hypothetical protein